VRSALAWPCAAQTKAQACEGIMFQPSTHSSAWPSTFNNFRFFGNTQKHPQILGFFAKTSLQGSGLEKAFLFCSLVSPSVVKET